MMHATIFFLFDFVSSSNDFIVYFVFDFYIFLKNQVAWVRVDTQTILSIHHNLITQNQRISLTHNDHRSWYLHIKEVEEEDRGWYMCQINTGNFGCHVLEFAFSSLK